MLIAPQMDDETGLQPRLVGFDLKEPTARQHGKPEAIAQLRQSFPYETIIMVGDGITGALRTLPHLTVSSRPDQGKQTLFGTQMDQHIRCYTSHDDGPCNLLTAGVLRSPALCKWLTAGASDAVQTCRQPGAASPLPTSVGSGLVSRA